MDTTIVADYVAPNGTHVVVVKLEGRVYTVRSSKAKTITIYQGSHRVTKRDAPNLFYALLNAYYNNEGDKKRAEISEATASIGIGVTFKANLTGPWTDAQLQELLQSKIEEALSTVETMLPESHPNGSGIMFTDVYWNNIASWDLERKDA